MHSRGLFCARRLGMLIRLLDLFSKQWYYYQLVYSQVTQFEGLSKRQMVLKVVNKLGTK